MLPLRNLQILRFHRLPLTLSSLSRSRLSLAVRPNITRALPVSAFSSAPSVATSGTQAATSDDEPRLSLTFTCTAGTCSTRSTHQFTKRAYEKGIVLIECPGCKTRHLIADNLGWFKDSTEDGKLRNVEDILRARGEAVHRGRLNPDGSTEIIE
ncbi:DNL zinc finger-domain-containing protein [Russula vinacea]|nr:DNL zinc finger-domain-containing protein [Russula vinacea]